MSTVIVACTLSLSLYRNTNYIDDSVGTSFLGHPVVYIVQYWNDIASYPANANSVSICDHKSTGRCVECNKNDDKNTRRRLNDQIDFRFFPLAGSSVTYRRKKSVKLHL